MPALLGSGVGRQAGGRAGRRASVRTDRSSAGLWPGGAAAGRAVSGRPLPAGEAASARTPSLWRDQFGRKEPAYRAGPRAAQFGKVWTCSTHSPWGAGSHPSGELAGARRRAGGTPALQEGGPSREEGGGLAGAQVPESPRPPARDAHGLPWHWGAPACPEALTQKWEFLLCPPPHQHDRHSPTPDWHKGHYPVGLLGLNPTLSGVPCPRL